MKRRRFLNFVSSVLPLQALSCSRTTERPNNVPATPPPVETPQNQLQSHKSPGDPEFILVSRSQDSEYWVARPLVRFAHSRRQEALATLARVFPCVWDEPPPGALSELRLLFDELPSDLVLIHPPRLIHEEQDFVWKLFVVNKRFTPT